MAFTPFSILRSPSVQAILRPQVSTPTPAPELPPAPSAFFRHTFSAASFLRTTDATPTPLTPSLPSSLPPAPRSQPAPPRPCTDIVPIGLPRDVVTTIPLPNPPELALVPVSTVRDITPTAFPLLTFRSVALSTKPKLSSGAPTPFSSISEALSTTIHRDTLAAPLVEAVASPLRDSMLQFPYTMATNHREFLNRSGLPVSQFGTKSHPHPVHKTIEINLLHDVWKHHATTPAAVLFMKPSKFQKLQRDNSNFTELHNYRLTPKATVRYPETSSSLPHTHTVFMHDALMYYTPGQILNLFSSAPEIQQLSASLVVPPESSFTDISLNPSLYKFRFENDLLVHHLEDNSAKNNEMRLGICSRSQDVVEPMIKPQWYIPRQYTSEWKSWLENIRDWCVSRQLWWGHRVPAWCIVCQSDKPEYFGVVDARWVVARNEEEARAQASDTYEEKFQLIQDPDVLDTWFPSGLFPMSVLGWPDDTEDLKAFYPTSVLETGHDILFFPVARLVMLGMTLGGNVPFTKVYLHPMIRDAHGRKMSKSLGNVIDPVDVINGVTLEVLQKKLLEGNLDAKEVASSEEGLKKDFPNGIEECGADALHFALVSYTADLTTLNPIIRDSVTYKDTPKLNVAFHQNPDNVALGVSKAVICGSVVIRGVLEVSSVRPSPSKA